MKRRLHSISILLFAMTLPWLGSTPCQAQIIASAGEDLTIEADEACQAIVTLDASATVIPEGEVPIFTWTGPFPEGDGTLIGIQADVILPLGEHEIALSVEDSLGMIVTDTVIITIADLTAPVIHSISASPNMIWPPNHKMVPIKILLEVSDNCPGEIISEITDITSNEAADTRGSGKTAPDHSIADSLKAVVRAERSGRGDGRIYTLTVKCTDAAGNIATAVATITVPHDMRAMKDSTHCIFKIDMRRMEKNRLMARLDIDEMLPGLPDDLVGWGLLIEIDEASFSGIFDEDLIIKDEDLRARFNRAGLLLIDIREIDLSLILGLDPDLDIRDGIVELPIRATLTPPEGAGEAIVIFDDTLECQYRQKAQKHGKGKKQRGKRKGKNK